jgi:hypothetical protein
VLAPEVRLDGLLAVYKLFKPMPVSSEDIYRNLEHNMKNLLMRWLLLLLMVIPALCDTTLQQKSERIDIHQGLFQYQ